MNYTSIFTGEEIDAAVQKALSLEWEGEVLYDASGVKGSNNYRGLPWFSAGETPGLSDYKLIALTGYPEGFKGADAGQTTQIIISTQSLRDRGGGVTGKTLNLPFSVRESNGDPRSTTIYFWILGTYLHWKTATVYGGSDEFVVTRVEGFALSTGGQ